MIPQTETFKGIEILRLPPYLNVNQVVENFGLCRQKVWDMILSGELPGRKVGKLWLVKSKDVIKFVESRKIT